MAEGKLVVVTGAAGGIGVAVCQRLAEDGHRVAALDMNENGLADLQGKIGAGQNKLQYAINLAQSQISGFSAAESRIRDTDVASEAANLTKAQVLVQASMAAMAQANSAPQAVLSLLRG